MSLEQPPKKRKKVSKNKKRNWAKTDITEIEEHLEAERIQLRTGGLAEEKSDTQLFFVDKKEVEESTPTAPKRKRKELKPLKSHAHLTIDTGAKPIIVSNAVPKSKKKIKKENKAAPPKKEQKKNTRARPTTYNLWANDERPKSEIEELVTKKRKKMPDSMKKRITSTLPAVEVPHPGQSYNPSLDDHQDLIQKALDVELKKEKERLKLKRALDDAFPSAEDAPTEASYIQEMTEGLYPSEEEEDEGDDPLLNPPVRREDKKTRRQRNKEAARKQKEAERLKTKAEKLAKQEFFRIKSYKKELKAHEKEIEDKAQLRAEKIEADKSKPKKLSQFKYEDPSIPVKLSHELEQSLRLLKPEGSLIEDRFKSLQRRNIIETRQRHKMKRKFKPKTFEKKGHKNVTL